MNFKLVSDCFQQIEKESSRLKMTELLADILKKANSREAAIICNVSLGELHPPYMNAQFNFAEKSAVSVVAKLLDESVEHVNKELKKQGDLGLVVMHGEWKHDSSVSLVKVYEVLDGIQKISGTGSNEDKGAALLKLLQSVDPISAKFIIRMVLGTLRLGFSDMTIIDALSWMETGDKSLRKTIEDAYNICADIGLLVETLKTHGVKGLEHMKIQLGIPIRPAAAERLPNAHAIFEKLGPCVAQPKLDGFRLQIHIDRKHSLIRFFSRNLKDMSAMFPDLVEALKKVKVSTLICEGEAIGYDPKNDSFLHFQETVKRKRKHGVEQAASDFPLKLFIFDVLYLDGKSLLEKTHEERYAILHDLFPHDAKSHVQAIQEKKIADSEQLEDYFLYALHEGLEGLVVKRPDAIYQPGKRNFNWIKLKRHAESKVEDTIDCAILGYYAGSGKRASFGIGAFLVGVLNEKKDMFQTVAKVGTGLTDDEWRDLKKRCDTLHRAEKPKNVECAKELYPDVWVTPDMVCMIQADEITRSPLHTACKTAEHSGLALRFPRFMGYREDKSASDATTTSELKDMYDHQKN